MTAADLFESKAAPLQERAGRALETTLIALVRAGIRTARSPPAARTR